MLLLVLGIGTISVALMLLSRCVLASEQSSWQLGLTMQACLYIVLAHLPKANLYSAAGLVIVLVLLLLQTLMVVSHLADSLWLLDGILYAQLGCWLAVMMSGIRKAERSPSVCLYV